MVANGWYVLTLAETAGSQPLMITLVDGRLMVVGH